jgi:hypothetical protein
MNIVILPIRTRTYSAKPFFARPFEMAGTLDGFIDFATPTETYTLTLGEARNLIAALNGTISDVEKNCLYDRDVLLEPR